MYKKIAVILLAVILVFALAGFAPKGQDAGEIALSEQGQAGAKESASDQFVSDKDSGYVIYFLDNYNGNSFHQTIESQFSLLADSMIADGTLSSYQILESNHDSATQIAQIESCILAGVDAIIIDPCSASALNGALEEA